MNFFRKPYRFAVVYSIFLTCLSTFVLLDAFVIPKAQVQVKQSTPINSSSAAGSQQADGNAGSVTTAEAKEAVITDTSYDDGNIQITIEKGRAYNSDYYVADIVLSSADYLKTALAQNTYGRNIKQTTSEMADAHNAILAINGDYYGFRDSGYVLRNGVLYRSGNGSAAGGASGQALLIDQAGGFSVESESQLSTADVKARSIQQILSFGPGLVVDGESIVSSGSSSRSQASESNPRTAIGQISDLHYVVIVVDGRRSESRGVTLAQLAELFVQRGCDTAYNLDGGGSSTLVFNGEVINNPTDGRKDGERQVSDIVYIGRE